MESGRPRPAKTDQLLVGSVSFSHADIQVVVEQFYRQVAEDPALKIPFQSVHDWPEHIERLTHFWWLRFGGKPYMMSVYNPVLKHYFAGFNQELLKRWLELFKETLVKNLSAEQVECWGSMAVRMGRALSMKNEMYHEYHEEKKKNERG